MINGINYNHYEFKSFPLLESNVKGFMQINYTSVFDQMMPVPFSKDNLRGLIDEVMLDDAVEVIHIGNLDCEVDTGAELIESCSNYGASLREISFIKFVQRRSMITADSISKLAKMCNRLQKLTITCMSALSIEAQGDLVDLFNQILQ